MPKKSGKSLEALLKAQERLSEQIESIQKQSATKEPKLIEQKLVDKKPLEIAAVPLKTVLHEPDLNVRLGEAEKVHDEVQKDPKVQLAEKSMALANGYL